MLIKQSIKTRLTQNMKAKHISNAHTKTRRERERKVTDSVGALFLPHLGRTFPSSKPLNRRWRGRIKPIQVRKEHEGFEKITKGSERGLKLILVPRCYQVVALLSGKPLVAIWSSMIGSSQWWQRCCFFCLGFWDLAFLALGFLTFFFSSLGGAPKWIFPCLSSH